MPGACSSGGVIPPCAGDASVVTSHIARAGANKKGAYEDILWALINSKEFTFNK